tara:strand:- start:94 stop:1326 length:1233 start_codon:yes stop_codon:yes gene_type:complete
VDLGNYEHQVCVLGVDRRVLEEFAVQANGLGERVLLERLRRLTEGDLSSCKAGTEATAGPIVEALQEAGVQVYGINPKQVDRFRDRHSVAGAKDDRRDALVLAGALATDLRSFRALSPVSEETIELRGLSREAEELKEDLRRTCNRIRSELLRYYPQVLELSPGADERWIWDLLELAPTPAEARRKTKGKIAGLLKANRIRRYKADEVRAKLKEPQVSAAAGVAKSASKHVRRLIGRARLLDQQLREIGRQTDALLAELTTDDSEAGDGNQSRQRDAKTLLSLPGAGRAVVATLLTEATEAISQRDYQSLRAQAGVAPVTRASGRRRSVSFRRACNPRLREALFHFAGVAIQHDTSARAHYDAQRAAGHGHPRALRGVGDRLLRIVVSMLRSGSSYDPSRCVYKRAASAA